MNELAAIASWPVGTAAAAVVHASGARETYGPIDHVFGLASVTKPVAALATLVAVEEGAITLAAAADADVLPGATLRHLLAHASGMGPSKYARAAAPEHRRIYSNPGFDRVAALVEAATGFPFADYLHEAVTEPLGCPTLALRGSAAHAGAGSVADLVPVVRELLDPAPRLLPASTVESLRAVQYPGLRGVVPGFGGQDPNDWGLGFEIRSHKSPHWTGSMNSPETFGHFGRSGTMFWVDPVAELGLIALADRDFDEWARQAWPALSDAVLASR